MPKSEYHFLMEDVYDYLMENYVNVGTNLKDAFPESWIDSDKATIYLASQDNKPLYKLTIKEIKNA
jgi:hypothetical protein